MKKYFNYGDGVITVDTVNGKTTVTVTDADGEATALDEANNPRDLTPEQMAAIAKRFGEPRRSDGQPF